MAPTSFSGTSQSNLPGTYTQPNWSPSEVSGTLNTRTVRPLDPTEGSPVQRLADSRLKHSELEDNQLTPLPSEFGAEFESRPPSPIPIESHSPVKSNAEFSGSIELDHLVPLIDEMIKSYGKLICVNPTRKDTDLFDQNLKIFHQALLKAPDSYRLPILKKLIQHFDALIESQDQSIKYMLLNSMLDTLLTNECYINAGETEQALFDAVKQLNRFDEIDIRRHEEYLTESREQVFQRKIPLRGPWTSMRNELLLIPSFSEVKHVSKIQKEELLEDKVSCRIKKLKVAVSEHNHIVLQQQAAKSCGQTCVAMLLMDLGIKPDFRNLEGCSTNEDRRMSVIKGLDLREIRNELSTENKQEFLEKLQAKIHENGSALIGVDADAGGHCIICDDISADLETVRIRDPWHGWEVSLDAEIFLAAVHRGGMYSTTIQQLQRT